MKLEETVNVIMNKLHDCVFCGLPKTEPIKIDDDIENDVYNFLCNNGLGFLMGCGKVVVFTTGLQLDKSFSDGQV